MRYGDLGWVEIEEGKKIQAEYLGRGTWCTAWKVDDVVYLIIREDYTKEILEKMQGEKHIPEMKFIGWVKDKRVYQTRYYPSVSAQNKRAWKDYRALEKAVDGLRTEPGDPDEFDNLKMCIDTSKVSRSLKCTFKKLIDTLTDYQTICIEITRRNLGVGPNHELILRDVLFDPEVER